MFIHQERVRGRQFVMLYISRQSENFWAFTGPRTDFGLILLISNMIIHRSFTDPIHLFSANVRGPASFAVFAYRCLRNGLSHRNGCWRWANPKCSWVWRQLGGKNKQEVYRSNVCFAGRGPRTSNFHDDWMPYILYGFVMLGMRLC